MRLIAAYLVVSLCYYFYQVAFLCFYSVATLQTETHLDYLRKLYVETPTINRTLLQCILLQTIITFNLTDEIIM